MLYSQEIKTCLATRIGAHGLDGGALAARLDRLAPALEALKDSALPHFDQPGRRDDLDEIAAIAAQMRGFDDVIVLGTGGSSLGGRALATVACDAAAPSLHFLDNVDPDSFDAVLRRLDPTRTGALIISKSGSTAETLTQALVILPWLADAGVDLATNAVGISDPAGDAAPSPLRRLADHYRFKMLNHVPGIGGRFAALTNVGLIPAAIAGLDPAKVRAGAAEALVRTFDAVTPAEAPPAIGAALSIGLAQENAIMQTVLMPYLDRFAPLAQWFCQLWAESLGKGGQGTTPIAARGTVDQHSQLQLWLDGPADKMFTLILGDAEGTGARLNIATVGLDGLDYLDGRTMGDLLAAEQEAIHETLVAAGRPVRVLRVKAADGESIGALMMHFMMETILAAHLLGVDPFDQPAVEVGKQLTRACLAAMKGGA
jgi:glucose-6-phosphate isomerase